MDHPRSSRSVWWLLAAAMLILAGILLTTATTAVLSITRAKVVERVEQPASVTYQDGRYHVGLRRYRSLGAPVVGGTTHRFWISRDPGLTYGHSFEIDATGADPTDFTVEWTADAITVRIEPGQEVTVPAEVFTGGR